MSKYILKEPIEAVQFKKGMEDGWKVLYTGNFFDYHKCFKTEEEARNFIDNNLGKNDVNSDDKNYEIIYEEPTPFIHDKIVHENLYLYNVTDYIIKDTNGRIRTLSKEAFEKLYVKVE